MNLIEQLGGYEKAKAFLNATSFTIDELIMMQRSGLRTQHVEKALLEYRRQHNIFEEGDKVVAIGEDYLSTVMTVERVIGEALECFESGYIFTFQGVRHATNAEIKAGKRLEVNQ